MLGQYTLYYGLLTPHPPKNNPNPLDLSPFFFNAVCSVVSKTERNRILLASEERWSMDKRRSYYIFVYILMGFFFFKIVRQDIGLGRGNALLGIFKSDGAQVTCQARD